MKRLFERIQQKPSHERRVHAMQLAGIVIAVIFAGWLGTLGVRLATENPAVAQSQNDPAQAGQTANVVEATNGNATLIVASSSDSQ